MSTLAFHDALKDLVENDTVFRSEISDLFGAPLTVVEGARELRQISDRSLPALILEQGDAEESGLSQFDDESMVIGSYFQGFEVSVLGGVFWAEKDLEKAHRQRTRLPEIFVPLILRNPDLGGASGVWVRGWSPDRGVRHPMHLWEIEFRGALEIERD